MAETTERRGTVKVFLVQGKGKKTFKKGESVKESNFPEGNFDALVKSGHLIEGQPQPVKPTIEDEKAKAAKMHADAQKAERDAAVKEATDLQIEVSDEMSTDDIKTAIEAKKASAEAEAKLTEAKATCDKYEIEYAEDADIDTLNQLIADYEAKNTKSFVNAKGETVVVKSIDDISKNDLVAELEKANAVFDKNAKKPVLFTQWMGLE